MTFLAQTEVPGLQVRMPSGEWLDVPYIPGSFAVNSGDMLQRWTNGRFKSTPHRALPPVGRQRYAIPFFLGPHIDTGSSACRRAGRRGQPAALPADHLRAVPALVVRRELQPHRPGGGPLTGGRARRTIFDHPVPLRLTDPVAGVILPGVG